MASRRLESIGVISQAMPIFHSQLSIGRKYIHLSRSLLLASLRPVIARRVSRRMSALRLVYSGLGAFRRGQMNYSAKYINNFNIMLNMALSRSGMGAEPHSIGTNISSLIPKTFRDMGSSLPWSRLPTLTDSRLALTLDSFTIPKESMHLSGEQEEVHLQSIGKRITVINNIIEDVTSRKTRLIRDNLVNSTGVPTIFSTLPSNDARISMTDLFSIPQEGFVSSSPYSVGSAEMRQGVSSYGTFPAMVARLPPEIMNGQAEEQLAKLRQQPTESKTIQPNPPSLDINRLSDQVYSIIERKVKVEKERRGIYG